LIMPLPLTPTNLNQVNITTYDIYQMVIQM
jgi:hypothetical protein